MKNTKKNIDSFKYILKLYLITRIILVILLILSEFALSNRSLGIYHHVFDLFDNEHYLNIAKYGYMNNSEYAFFPLTSLLIRYLGKIGFMILNQICVFCSGILLYLISDKIFKNKNNYFATFLYFISPISIFTCMFYSEGLFLFLTILAFYLYKSKKSYLALGITLGLSVLTRSLGSMLFFAIFIFMVIDLFKKKEKFKNILITYIPATIISCLYPIYLYVKTGDFLYFLNVQYTHWGRVNTNIFTIMFDAFKYIFTDGSNFILILEYFIVFGLIIYVFWFIIRHRKEKKYYEIFLYMILSLISICSTIRGNIHALASFYRYIFGCFPIYFMFKKHELSFLLISLLTFFVSIFFLLGVYFF